MKRDKIILTVITVMVFSFASCSSNDETNNTTRMEVRLTDAPAPYDAVNIDIQSVSINATNSESSGWQDLNILKSGVYNLLNFQNGIDTLLANQDIPSGRISQIRLVLGTNNTIVKNGVTYPLNTPSGLQSGIKLNVQDELLPNIIYRLWIDFDASRSIVETGTGNFQLKPVIRAYTEATSGSIEGTVLPLEANATVRAILNTDTLMAYPNTNGYYKFPGVSPSASWKLIFDADDITTYKDSIKTDIVVSKGNTTIIPTLTLRK